MSIAPGVPDPPPADRPSGKNHRGHEDRPEEEARPRFSTADPQHPESPPLTGVIATAGAGVAVALPWTFPPGGGPTTFDLAVGAQVDPYLDPRPWVAEVLAAAAGAGVVFAVLCGSAVWFAWQRRWWEALTVALVPEIAVAFNTLVLKPWWGRPLHDYLAYPSGHTVHLVSVVATLVLLLRSVRARLVIIALAVTGWCAAAVGMIALDYHLATDVVGGAGAGIVLAIAGHRLAVSLRRAVGSRYR